MRTDRLYDRLLKALLVYSFALLFFGYGAATVHWKVFPYKIIRDAALALGALVEVYAPRKSDAGPSEPWSPGPSDSSQAAPSIEPAVRDHAGTSRNELILISGGRDHLKKHSPNGCLAWLMDRAGAVKHVWHYDPHLWGDLRSVHKAPGKFGVYPVGLHLYEDGGLLVSFQGDNCFPISVGLARFDRDSRLIWKRELSHHWFTVAEDGRIYVPSVRVADAPIPVGNTGAEITSPEGKILSDTVLVLGPDGNTLEEISILDALVKSGWVGLFPGATYMNTGANTDDPTHLNDVRVVSSALAASSDRLAAGDILVSLRSLNAVGILDAKTRRFKWMSAGTTLRQHSPRFFRDGILVFDNLGGPQDIGGSRLVRICLATGVPETVFPRSTQALPGEFFSETAGHLDVDEDGRRVLVAITNAGVVWEVDLDGGEVLWEYGYIHIDKQAPRPLIFTAKYVDPQAFPFPEESENR